MPLHETNLNMYIAFWVFLPTIALICCCCNGCEHFEGGRAQESLVKDEYEEMVHEANEE